ncbi:N-acetylmuramoyl-L-alanine amidase family protein [Aneurinibacillus migulanus]|uniref:N-acetylmuramoyl-L-alanine amidase family protein n=1 Tax=Aneurinibacillus migulanus TaxID=47500 RepID=UPI00209C7F82|nr:N-acetylmuramoyl-L-alanine amidase [Aneurinibacillus migulanus]MCP1355815.1 N-acetylmuramoyl-L-alanine amidase [Aneurinibacillus migulanus]
MPGRLIFVFMSSHLCKLSARVTFYSKGGIVIKPACIAIILLCTFFISTPSLVEAVHTIHTPVDILIDAGHGGVDGGAVSGDILEKNITLQVAQLLYKQLSLKGYSVVLNRTGDYALSEENQWLNTPSRHQKDLAQRKHLAQELSPKIMISLHVNTSSNPANRGPLVLYQKNNQSFMLADIMQHSLNKLYKTTELPRPGKRLYLLNHSICPTVLVEIGFLSNPTDRIRMTTPSQQIKIASTISSSVDAYFLLLNQTPFKEMGRKGKGRL